VIHVEVAAAVMSVVSADAGVTVDQTTPTVKLSIHVQDSHGKPFLVRARTVEP